MEQVVLGERVYVVTIGAITEAMIKEYIEEQEERDMKEERNAAF